MPGGRPAFLMAETVCTAAHVCGSLYQCCILRNGDRDCASKGPVSDPGKTASTAGWREDLIALPSGASGELAGALRLRRRQIMGMTGIPAHAISSQFGCNGTSPCCTARGFFKTLCICNMCSWDTDCNVGNVGCILGTLCGLGGKLRTAGETP